MRVTLVNPPCLWAGAADLAPPLWALQLGRAARAVGADPRLIDLNREVLADPAQDTPDLPARTAERVLNDDPAVLAISSMAVNSHVGLSVAAACKARQPRLVVVAGGPHFSAIAADVLDHYPAVDAVAVGEAEASFAALLAACAAGQTLAGIPGLCVRGVAYQPAPPPRDWHEPDYDLVDLDAYWAVNPRRLMDFEPGRGCVFRCAYCYAPGHFGVGHRSPDRAATTRRLAHAVDRGTREMFFVQDNLTNTEVAVQDLVGAVRDVGRPISFHGYSTIAGLTPVNVTALASAGCQALYVGVDAVHPLDRARHRKPLYHGDADLHARITECHAAGIRTTMAFLLREDARVEWEATVAAAAAAVRTGSAIRLNVLTPYAGTATRTASPTAFTPDDLKPRLTMAVPEVVRDNPESRTAPYLFPFHSVQGDARAAGRFVLRVNALFHYVVALPDVVERFAIRGRSWDLVDTALDDTDPAAVARWTPAERADFYFDCLQRVGGRGMTPDRGTGPPSAIP